eukprot:m.580132 g.580132  ORF g.580132 m.580132 type:complete len:939 (+) comp22320_c0_seq2:195-3011(+)
MASPALSDSVEVLVPQVRIALQVLYEAQDAERKQEADAWLRNLQQSPNAWDTAQALYALPDAQTHEKFMALNMLQSNIVRVYNTLETPEQVIALKDILLQMFVDGLCQADGTISGRLCILVVRFAIKAVPESWENVLANITTLVGSNIAVLGEERGTLKLLEFAAIFAEEIETSQTQGERRSKLMGELRNGLPSILAVIKSALASKSLQVVVGALKCLKSWVNVRTGIVSPDDIGDHLTVILSMIAVQDVREAAADAMLAIIQQGQTENYPATIRALAPLVLQWRDVYDRGVAEQDDESTNVYAKVAIALATEHIRTLMDVKSPAEAQHTRDFLAFVLEMTNHPGIHPVSDDVSGRLHYFWGLFLDELQDPQTDEQLARYRELYSDILVPLLQVVCRKLQHAPDDAALSGDELKEFREYRNEYKELICTLCLMMKGECQRLLVEFLETSVNPTSSTVPWQQVEAVLYALRASADTLRADETTYTPRIFAHLEHVGQQPQVIQTALLMVGAYAEWLNENPSCLPSALQLLLQAIHVPKYIRFAAIALCDVCQDCSAHIAHDASAIIGACYSALQGPVQQKTSTKITMALCRVISSLPAEEALQEGTKLCGALTQRLPALAASPDNTDELLNILRMLRLTCKELVPQQQAPEVMHPVVSILRTAWPGLTTVLQTPHEEAVIGTVLEIMQEGCKTVQSLFYVFLGDLLGSPQDAGLVARTFAATANVGVFKLAEQLHGQFSGQDDCKELLQRMLVQISSTFFSLFESTVRENPELAQGYFELMRGVMRRRQCRALAVGNTELTSYVLQACTHAIQCPEHPTVKSALQVIRAYAEVSTHYADIASVFDAHGSTMLDIFFRGIAGQIDRSLVSDVVRVLQIMKKNVAPVQGWAAALLGTPGYPNAVVSEQAKREFLTHLGLQQTTFTQLERFANGFANACRGM